MQQLWKNAQHLETSATLGKMSHIRKNTPHLKKNARNLKKCATVEKLRHT